MEDARKSKTENDVGLGLREEAEELINDKKVTLMSHLHPQPSLQPLPSSSSSSSSCACALFSNNGYNGNDNRSSNVDGPSHLGLGQSGSLDFSSTNHVGSASILFNTTATTSPSLPPLPIHLMQPYSFSSSSPSLSFNTSSQGEMAGSGDVRVPYTVPQWQEVERQSMIYKYMMASLPVPPELLLPTTTTPELQSNSLGLGEMGVPSNNSMDPEPWRCKRTDGKKWRCSRDVAPDQKYCERHSHKSRPRSRKPVELHSNPSTQTTNYTSNSHLLHQTSRFPDQRQPNRGASLSSGGLTSNWFLTGETLPDVRNSPSEASWQYMNICQLDSSHYDFGGGYSWQNRQLNDRGRSKSPSVERGMSQRQETRHFIDAWSSDNNGGVGRDFDKSMYDDQWMSSSPGGPLAEALCLGISGSEGKGASHSGTCGVRGCDTT